MANRGKLLNFINEVQEFLKEHKEFTLVELASHLGYVNLNSFKYQKLPIILEYFHDCLKVEGSGFDLKFMNTCFQTEKRREANA